MYQSYRYAGIRDPAGSVPSIYHRRMSVIACYYRLAPAEYAALYDAGFDPGAWDENADRLEAEGRSVDIDQAHEALEAVLRAQGTAVPVVYAGRPVEDTEIGYGPIMLIPPHEVEAAAAALESRPAEAVITRETVRAAAGIGPVDDWSSADGLDYLRSAHSCLRTLYGDAHRSRQLVVLIMQ
ncbi:hypothetical protein AXK57_10915 [Tsukamurella pulmonis]|nr:hypothetical protein AXK57_10915 [Tsukamurella pulmonis]